MSTSNTLESGFRYVSLGGFGAVPTPATAPAAPAAPPADVPAEAVVKLDTPTIKTQSYGWMICNTSLGCGSRIFQGWSTGIGLEDDNTTNFERKLFTLLYLSKHPGYTKNRWDTYAPGRNVEAPIGVNMLRHQFLKKDTTYTFNSHVDWVARLVNFIKKHDLGEVSVGHAWKNHHYRGDMNQTGTWTWNGNVPKSVDCGISDWRLPE